jgi:hypothetical protein
MTPETPREMLSATVSNDTSKQKLKPFLLRMIRETERRIKELDHRTKLHGHEYGHPVTGLNDISFRELKTLRQKLKDLQSLLKSLDAAVEIMKVQNIYRGNGYGRANMMFEDDVKSALGYEEKK